MFQFPRELHFVRYKITNQQSKPNKTKPRNSSTNQSKPNGAPVRFGWFVANPDLKRRFGFEDTHCSKSLLFLSFDLNLFWLSDNLAERFNRLRTSLKMIFLKFNISSYSCKSLLNCNCKSLTKSETCHEDLRDSSSLTTSSIICK